MPKKKQRRSPFKRLLRLIIFVVSLSLASVVALAGALVYFHTQDLPDINDVNLIANSQTSKIYSSDGALLANLFSENRTVVPIKAVSNFMIQATVAAEDQRFFEHQGIDFKGMVRALAEDIKAGDIKQGGSTISQQYIKNAYFTNEQTVGRKIKEAILAFNLERQSSKQQILEKYLNIIYFGHGAYGIEAASETFFNKNAKDLTLAEAALLAGIIKNPSKYSPYVNPNNALTRRNHILKRMAKLKLIKNSAYTSATSVVLSVQPITRKHYKQADYYVENVRKDLFSTYGENLLLRGGLKVVTTLDSRLQKIAEESAYKELNKPGDPSVALVAIDVNTGAIKAMVGGRDFRTSQFNLATQSKRQPGSAFKAFLLAAAITKGISPLHVYSSNSPMEVKLPGQDWTVSNYEGAGKGSMTLKEATARSVNTVFARLMLELKPALVVSMARNLGITSDIKPNLAIALGGLEIGVSPIDMASAYMSFANGGYLYNRYYVEKITDFNGKALAFAQPLRKQVLDSAAAYLVTDTLKDVVNNGTGKKADINPNVAGKTGTTQDYGDAWFVGYSSSLVVSVWVGYPDKKVPMKNIKGRQVTGGSFPTEIWRDFMLKASARYPFKEFPGPGKNQLVKVITCAETDMQHYRATDYCASKKEQVFVKGYEPVLDCPSHRPVGSQTDADGSRSRRPLIPFIPGAPEVIETEKPKVIKRPKINNPVIPKVETPTGSKAVTSGANR